MTIVTQKKITIKVTEGKKRQRLDTYLANSLEHTSRTRIQKIIKADLVSVNNKIAKSNYTISPNDEIIILIPISPRPETLEPENIPLNIIYEDDYLIVINKPNGMVVHPSYGNYTGTLVHALLFHTKNNLSGLNGNIRSGIVHRIDKGTTGLLVIAKDEYTHSELAKQFASHSTEREYWALCWGKFDKTQGEIITNIARSKQDRKIFSVSESTGKVAHTYYEVIEEFEFLSLIKLKLKTGRTHQIRVHLAHIKHNIFGDPTYGGRRINYGFELPRIKARVNNLLSFIDRQALHAKTLGFFHPIKKEKMIFDSELPEDFKNLLNKIKVDY